MKDMLNDKPIAKEPMMEEAPMAAKKPKKKKPIKNLADLKDYVKNMPKKGM